ncbi:hypothetical protein [Haloferula sp.]|uniref:hypothetical protein n=1 Tax=Haloferula sp. TaxID=2497595 RepID=UPI003C72732A
MRILISLLILLSPSISFAQGKSEEGRQVQCRFLSFGSNGKQSALNASAPGGDKIPCPLSASRISDPIVCIALDNKINFTSPDDATLQAVATIPSGVRSAILIFLPASKSAPLPWKVITINDSAKGFPPGGALVANFHKGDIRYIIGEHKGALHQADTKTYAMPTKRDSFNMAPVIFEFQQDDDWRKANESALRFLPGVRYLFFAYTDPRSKRPRIKTYKDFSTVSASNP